MSVSSLPLQHDRLTPTSLRSLADCPVFAPTVDKRAAAACKPAVGILSQPLGNQTDNTAVARLPGCNLPCQ